MAVERMTTGPGNTEPTGLDVARIDAGLEAEPLATKAEKPGAELDGCEGSTMTGNRAAEGEGDDHGVWMDDNTAILNEPLGLELAAGGVDELRASVAARLVGQTVMVTVTGEHGKYLELDLDRSGVLGIACDDVKAALHAGDGVSLDEPGNKHGSGDAIIDERAPEEERRAEERKTDEVT
jgi:hypothetical protein